MSPLNRRNFLRLAAAGAGVGALGTVSGPFGLLSRAHAASGIAGASGGAIFIVLNGGARSQAVFNGMVGSGANPFGQISGLPVPMSAVMEGSGLDDPEINRHINLVTTVAHHNRSGSHATGRSVACTGYTPEEGKPGILSILNHAFAFRDVPCVNIGNDTPTTAIGSEISSTFSPVKINTALDVNEISASLVDSAVSEDEKLRLDSLRNTLQDRFLRATPYDAPADIPFYQRRAIEIAQQFDNDALDIRADASMGRYLDGSPVRNGGLRGSFNVADNGRNLGAAAMLAVRLRQLGCGGITISTGNWDMHSNEEGRLPGRANEVGGVIAGLIGELSQIESPLEPGRSLLDTTVITVLSDFGRGNWSNGTGFNSDRGSDHRSREDKTAFQCIPIIGGGLAGGQVLGEITNGGSPAAGSPTYTTRQVLATALDVLGIPPTLYMPEDAPPLTEDLS